MPDERNIPTATPPMRLYGLLLPYIDRGDLDGLPTGKVLCQMLGIESQDARCNWYSAHGDLTTMVGAAQDYVRQHVANYDVTNYARTNAALATALGEMAVWDPWAAQRQKLESIVRYSLPYWTDVAPSPVRDIASSDATSIRAALNELVELVLTSDYPPDFKLELTRSLNQVKDRIDRFTIFGPEGVKATTASLVGVLAVNAPAARSRQDIVEKSAGVVIKIADVFLKGYEVGKVAAAAVTRLLGPGQ